MKLEVLWEFTAGCPNLLPQLLGYDRDIEEAFKGGLLACWCIDAG
jgi:hypothetical protein